MTVVRIPPSPQSVTAEDTPESVVEGLYPTTDRDSKAMLE